MHFSNVPNTTRSGCSTEIVHIWPIFVGEAKMHLRGISFFNFLRFIYIYSCLFTIFQSNCLNNENKILFRKVNKESENEFQVRHLLERTCDTDPILKVIQSHENLLRRPGHPNLDFLKEWKIHIDPNVLMFLLNLTFLEINFEHCKKFLFRFLNFSWDWPIRICSAAVFEKTIEQLQ